MNKEQILAHLLKQGFEPIMPAYKSAFKPIHHLQGKWAIALFFTMRAGFSIRLTKNDPWVEDLYTEISYKDLINSSRDKVALLLKKAVEVAQIPQEVMTEHCAPSMMEEPNKNADNLAICEWHEFHWKPIPGNAGYFTHYTYLLRTDNRQYFVAYNDLLDEWFIAGGDTFESGLVSNLSYFTDEEDIKLKIRLATLADKMLEKSIFLEKLKDSFTQCYLKELLGSL